MRRIALSVMAVLAFDATAFAQTGDHYLCYATRFGRTVSVNLTDAFDSGAYQSKGSRIVCAPASKDGSPVADPATHLVGYRFSAPLPAHTQRVGLGVDNQFGHFTINTFKSRSLLVPSNKSLPPAPPPSPPNLTLIDVDHFRCITSRITPGTPGLPAGVVVTVADQFGSRTVQVKKFLKLCIPTNKNGEGIKHADRLLMCYRAARPNPKHQRVDAQFADQFGVQLQRVGRVGELCVPATASSVSGAFLDLCD